MAAPLNIVFLVSMFAAPAAAPVAIRLSQVQPPSACSASFVEAA
jgi:hypothetical protein